MHKVLNDTITNIAMAFLFCINEYIIILSLMFKFDYPFCIGAMTMLTRLFVALSEDMGCDSP